MSTNESTFLNFANPCTSPPIWAKAPAPTINPLTSMKWATGKDKDKFGCTRDGNTKFHAGIDIKAEKGTDCFATEDGKVDEVGTFGELGTCVCLSFKKDGKTYGVAYCHLSKASVTKGATVKAGDKVGSTGLSGNADASNPHLHFEVQNQVWVAYDDSASRSKYGLNPNDYISGV